MTMRHSGFLVSMLMVMLALLGAQSTRSQPEETLDERPLIKVPADGKYKAVYDIRSDEQAAGVNRGLYYVRGLIEAFRKQGVETDQLDIHVVLHGESGKAVLIDDSYQVAVDDPFSINPDARLVSNLIELGVNVEMCHSAMKSKGWTADDILPDVVIVHDGFTRLIQLQDDGYAYIGGY